MKPQYQHDSLYINGRWTPPHGSGRTEVRSPATEEIIGYVPAASEKDIDAAVRAARNAFDESAWPLLPYSERAQYLRRAATVMSEQAGRLAAVLVDECGIPVRQAALLSGRPQALLEYYADLGEALHQEEVRIGKAAAVRVRREPVGVAGIITPWNSPAAIAHFALAAAFITGCTVVLKTPPEAPLHGQILGEIYDAAGLPPGVLNIVAASREVAATLTTHPGVDKISFTGSTTTGRQIASTCGSLLKRCTLELGGKSAAIILDDADLAAAMPALVGAAIQNNGEACVGQTRILVPTGQYDTVVEAFLSELGARRTGDPYDVGTDIGPLISGAQRDRVEGFIRSGLDGGATLLHGGGRPADLPRGFYVEPTVFGDVDNAMTIAREEIFGPVFCLIRYDSDDDAARIANDSDYGLSGTVWTSDSQRGLRVARRIRSGNVGVNTFGLEICSPFGGYKNSGIGRQLGPEGLNAYVELKAIHEPLQSEVLADA
jgi:aldehyde dehydrogenase (NAD+)